jgi:hypothetical protein
MEVSGQLHAPAALPSGKAPTQRSKCIKSKVVSVQQQAMKMKGKWGYSSLMYKLAMTFLITEIGSEINFNKLIKTILYLYEV